MFCFEWTNYFCWGDFIYLTTKPTLLVSEVSSSYSKSSCSEWGFRLAELKLSFDTSSAMLLLIFYCYLFENRHVNLESMLWCHRSEMLTFASRRHKGLLKGYSITKTGTSLELVPHTLRISTPRLMWGHLYLRPFLFYWMTNFLYVGKNATLQIKEQ